jgi:hypothetical protein
MVYRIPIYVVTLLALVTVGVQGMNSLRKKTQRLDYKYLLNSVQADIRVNSVRINNLNKEIDKLTKELGEYNDELNPYQ